MWHFEKLHFSVKAAAQQNVLRRMKIDRADNTLVLVAVISIYQFVKVKVFRFQENFLFTIYSSIGLQECSNWIYLILSTGHFASGVLCCFAGSRLRPVEKVCWTDDRIILLL